MNTREVYILFFRLPSFFHLELSFKTQIYGQNLKGTYSSYFFVVLASCIKRTSHSGAPPAREEPNSRNFGNHVTVRLSVRTTGQPKQCETLNFLASVRELVTYV